MSDIDGEIGIQPSNTENSYQPPLPDKTPTLKKSDASTENREISTKTEFSIALNKEVLRKMAIDHPALAEMFDTFGRLPDKIAFTPGVNFIFGKNGSGKSTLANSLYMVAKAAELARYYQEEAQFDLDDTEKNQPPAFFQDKALRNVLDPGPGVHSELAFLIKAGIAPDLIRRGGVTMDTFHLRNAGGQWGSPPIEMIQVQDLLGADKQRELDYRQYNRTQGRTDLDELLTRDQGSARQMLEKQLEDKFAAKDPGSIVFIDETTIGLSPWRQEVYIKKLHQIAEEKGLVVIAAENSGFAWEGDHKRIHLEEPEKGNHTQDVNDTPSVDLKPYLENQETVKEPSFEVKINKDAINILGEKYVKFRPMLASFWQLPDTLQFTPGKTEIFADNGGGKTTFLNTLYLLMKIEETRILNQSMGLDSSRETAASDILNPSQPREQQFIQSAGLGLELIKSGAISLGNFKDIPVDMGWNDPKPGLDYFNLIEFSGNLTNDTLRVVDSAIRFSDQGIGDALKADQVRNPDTVRRSTRQTIEQHLLAKLDKMAEGGYLFVDEIDGGISPDRQLINSVEIHKKAQERNITLIATSNSYEGYKYPVASRIDLQTAPSTGIQKPTYTI
jgi:predicted ATPase